MPESMSSGWYYSKQGRDQDGPVGPLTWEELFGLGLSGSLLSQDLVWNEGMPDWVPAQQIPGLFPATQVEAYQTATAPAAAPATMPNYAAQQRAWTGPEAWPIQEQPVQARRSHPTRRRSWLLPVLIPVIALILVGGGLGAYFGFFYDKGDATVGNGANESGKTTTTLEDADVLGVAEIKAIDPERIIETETWGPVPADRVYVALNEGTSRKDAEGIATILGGSVVGEIEFVDLYEIETAGVTEADLQAMLEQARALPGVRSAMPNVAMGLDNEIWGVRQSPLNDPAYANGRDGGYKLIGAQKAWDYIKGSGLPVTPVHSGFADAGLWRGSGDFDGDTQIYFPDQSAGEISSPEMAQNVNGEWTENPTGSHGTMTMGSLCGDPGNGGTAGLASVPLGEDLTVSLIDTGRPPYGVTSGEVVAPDPDDPTVAQWSNGTCYSLGGLKALLTLVKSGAKVINCSWSSRPDTETAEWAQAYQQFFEKMSVEHPDVLFVCTAGNRGETNPYKDGAVTWPGGRNLPNMITVGNVLNDGTLRSTSNRQNDQPGHEYEVTLAAPGHEAIQGLDADGTPLQAGMVSSNGVEITGGGTSAAAPMVSAAATLLLSLDPELTAGEIKQILSETARSGPAELGGRILAMDLAVLEVINRQREHMGLPRVTGEELEKGGVIDAVAISQEETNTWLVKAIVESLPSVQGAEITITSTTGTKIEGQLSQKITEPGEIVWMPVTVPNDVAEITVTRSDNGASSIIRFEVIDLNGYWVGSFVFTDVVLSPEAQAEFDAMAENPPEELEGCDLSSIAAVLEQLKGKKCPMTMDIVANEGGTGTVSLLLDFSALGESAEAQESAGVPLTWAGNSITISSSENDSAATITGTAAKVGDDDVMTGQMTIVASEEGKMVYTLYAEWTLTKQ